MQDLLIILQHELNKININNKPKNKTEIEQKLDELFQCVHIMKHPSSIITWKALVALARDIHCHFNSVSLNHVTKFFLESTTYDNNNKRKCKMFWDDPKADVQQFMESVDFVLCVNYIKNTHMKVVWINKKDYKPEYMLYDDLKRKLYYEMLNRFCSEGLLNEFFYLCPLLQQDSFSFDFLKIHAAIRDNPATTIFGFATKKDEVLQCYNDIEMTFTSPRIANNLQLRKFDNVRC